MLLVSLQIQNKSKLLVSLQIPLQVPELDGEYTVDDRLLYQVVIRWQITGFQVTYSLSPRHSEPSEARAGGCGRDCDPVLQHQ